MLKNIFGRAIIAIAWSIGIQILLCLPGSSIPSGGWFDIPNLDKIVHCFLFGGVTAVWCYYFYLKGKPSPSLATIFFVVYLLVSADGIILEFIQRDYIPNRSFDKGDIIADISAASIAYGICNVQLLFRNTTT